MNKNIIRELRKQANEAWINHFNWCGDQKVWSILNVGLTEIRIVELSWKHKWIEQKLDEYLKEL
jgi:hypothetical protein